MKNKIIQFALLSIGLNTFAQVGINTTSPASTIDVNGSFATPYRTLPVSSESESTLTDTDYYINYTGSSDYTLHLPSANTTLPFKGREYVVRNPTDKILTVIPVGSEKIDIAGSESSSISVPKGYVASFKNTGNTSGTTWVLTSLSLSGLPEDQKILKYAAKTTTPINASTPTESETCIGVLCIRFAGTSPSGYQSGGRFQVKFDTQTNYSFSRWLFGAGANATSGAGGYGRGNIAANTWLDLDADGLNPSNDDMTSYIISAISPQKMYRVNTILSSDKSNPSTQSVVKIFIEELE
ncbi:hypothetical protein SAMN05421866_0812 [Chryseobacterium oranimense]|jgi:hypothetical protein|uniref:Uncharacterized protein n=1 Tax=Chryseobacterium oranimense TaxID=421058 RepID=A0A1M5KRI7_9FLAO|nr:hypothetical protein [Chryseobacterium oranimense]SHG55472.1 hypothetical protein SAMN05421866_0812 [Chryseobacterium oranimense]